MDETIVGLTRRVARISNSFEENQSELKRKYLQKNIYAFNFVAKKIEAGRGTFGTGYPFYAFDPDMTGEMPIIEEQIRYNNELVEEGKESKREIWGCRGCLQKYGKHMPDLKMVCKPCPKMDNTLKPRKLINRLPDIDMWIICEDGKTPIVQEELSQYFKLIGLRTSDVDPLRTIEDMDEIVTDLENGKMPKKLLPLDAHIMEKSQMLDLINSVPEAVEDSFKNKDIPYLPIHPKSLRKKWQHDDEAYNFIFDYFSAFTEFDVDSDIKEALDRTRKELTEKYSEKELFEVLLTSCSLSQARRFQNHRLQMVFLDKLDRWKKIPTMDAKEKGKTWERE